MRGRDIGGAHKTSPEHRLEVSLRHAELKAAGLCINGGLVFGKPGRKGIVHGPVVSPSGRCEHCEAVAKRSR
jgi:hypothetical protein